MLSRTASSLIRRQCQTAGVTVRSFASARFVAAPVASSFAVPNQHQQMLSIHQQQHQHQQQQRRAFSDTHDDFAPQKKEVPENAGDEATKMIEDHVTSNPVMVYMKGNPSMPMCGFSAKIVQTLQAEGVDFSSVNVLDYPSIREGVKKYAAWPTIPQLYVNGEFIGGTDIVTQMHESGELKELLEEIKAAEEQKE